MTQQGFVILAYGVALAALGVLVVHSFVSMQRSERAVDTLRRES